MTFMECAIAMNNDYCECNIAIDKCNVFIEAARREFEIHKKEAALKVLKENGTREDYEYLVEEANEGYIERFKKSVKRIIDAVIKFINDMKQKLSDIFTAVKTRKTLDAIESAVKKNPDIGKAKVKYADTDTEMGMLDRLSDSISKRISKIKSKKKVDADDESEIEELPKKRKKIVAGVAVGATLTVVGALAVLGKYKKAEEISYERWNEVYDELTSDIDEDDSSDETQAMLSLIKNKADTEKEKARLYVLKSTSLLEGLKHTFSELRENVKSIDIAATALEEKIETRKNDKKEYNEYISNVKKPKSKKNDKTQKIMPRYINASTEIEDIYDLPMFRVVQESVKPDDDIVTESSNDEGLDLDQYFNDLCDSVIGESVKPEDDDEDYTRTYMEQMESELFGENSVMVSAKPEEDDLLSFMKDLF